MTLSIILTHDTDASPQEINEFVLVERIVKFHESAFRLIRYRGAYLLSTYKGLPVGAAVATLLKVVELIRLHQFGFTHNDIGTHTILLDEKEPLITGFSQCAHLTTKSALEDFKQIFQPIKKAFLSHHKIVHHWTGDEFLDRLFEQCCDEEVAWSINVLDLAVYLEVRGFRKTSSWRTLRITEVFSAQYYYHWGASQLFAEDVKRYITQQAIAQTHTYEFWDHVRNLSLFSSSTSLSSSSSSSLSSSEFLLPVA